MRPLEITGNILRGTPLNGGLRLINCPDMGANSLTVRFDDGDRSIERGARLLVAEGQMAQFVYMGKYGDLFGPGEYRLETDNIPIITALKSWRFGFESPFKADVYFVATKLFTGCKWGTAHPVMVNDSRLGVVRLRAHGTYDFRITNIPLFLSQVAGTDHNFTLAEFEETMRTRIASSFSQALALSGIEASMITARHYELGNAFLPAFNNVVKDLYGVELVALTIESVSLPPEVEKMIDSGASIRAIGGDLQTYMQIQLARSMGSGSGTLTAPTELALGLQAARMVGTSPPPFTPATLANPAPHPPLLSDSGSSVSAHLPPLPNAETSTQETCTPAHAAAQFGIPFEAIEQAIAEGKLKSYELLGHQVVKSGDLRSLLKQTL
jgi:membrane protease subunit (stomatin/prohibitin family)